MKIIHPRALYTKADMIELFQGVDIDYLLSRLRCKKRFASLWWGTDILAALEIVPVLGEETAIYSMSDVLPPTTKANKKKNCTKLIGRIFTADEIGVSDEKEV